MRPISFQLFEIITAHGRQVALVIGGTNRLNAATKGLYDIEAESAGKPRVNLQPIQAAVFELDLYSYGKILLGRCASSGKYRYIV